MKFWSSVTNGAKLLGVRRKSFSALLNGKSGISPEIALLLSKVFGRTPEGWLKLQLQYDLWQIEQKVDLSYLKKLRLPKLYSCSKLDEIFHKNLEIVK